MGQDISVSLKAVNSTATKAILVDIDSRAHSAINDRGKEMRELMENLVEVLLGSDCSYESSSSRDFESSFSCWKAGKNKELWENPEMEEEYSEVEFGSDRTIHWQEFQNYTPEWWKPLPEVQGEEHWVCLYGQFNTNCILFKGYTQKEIADMFPKMAKVFYNEVEYIRVGNYLVNYKGEKIDIFSLSVEEQQKFGVTFKLTQSPIPEDIARVLTVRLGNYSDSDGAFRYQNGVAGLAPNMDTRSLVSLGKLAVWEKGGQLYLYSDSIDFLKKMYILGVVDLSPYHIVSQNQLLEEKYREWLKNNEYVYLSDYRGIEKGNAKIHNFKLKDL